MHSYRLHLFALAFIAYAALPSLADVCVEVPADYVAQINPTSSITYLSLTSKDKSIAFKSANPSAGWIVNPLQQGNPGGPYTFVPNHIEIGNGGQDFKTEWGVFRLLDKDYKVGKWYWLQKFHGCYLETLDYKNLLDVQVFNTNVSPPKQH